MPDRDRRSALSREADVRHGNPKGHTSGESGKVRSRRNLVVPACSRKGLLIELTAAGQPCRGSGWRLRDPRSLKSEHPAEGQGAIQITHPNPDVIHPLDGDGLRHHHDLLYCRGALASTYPSFATPVFEEFEQLHIKGLKDQERV